MPQSLYSSLKPHYTIGCCALYISVPFLIMRGLFLSEFDRVGNVVNPLPRDFTILRLTTIKFCSDLFFFTNSVQQQKSLTLLV